MDPKQDHPGAQPQHYNWSSPWPAWPLALRARRSFAMAAVYGGISSITQLIVGAVFFALMFFVYTDLPAIETPSYLDLIGLIAIPLPFVVTTFLILWAASRMIDPEIRLMGGFGNLNLGAAFIWSLLLPAILAGLFFAILGLGMTYFGLGQLGLAQGFAGILLILVAAILGLTLFLQLCWFALSRTLKWPLQLDHSRLTLGSNIWKPQFLGSQLLLIGSLLLVGGLIWLAVAGLGGILVSMSGLWMMAIVILIAYVLGFGYGILILASMLVAPFRMLGWTINENDSISSLFE